MWISGWYDRAVAILISTLLLIPVCSWHAKRSCAGGIPRWVFDAALARRVFIRGTWVVLVVALLLGAGSRLLLPESTQWIAIPLSSAIGLSAFLLGTRGLRCKTISIQELQRFREGQ